jgi:hypothetical protein
MDEQILNTKIALVIGSEVLARLRLETVVELQKLEIQKLKEVKDESAEPTENN